VAEGSRDLDQLVHVAMSIYYNRDLQKEKKDLGKGKRKDKWQEALSASFREASQGQSLNPRTCFQCGQAGHFRRQSPQRKLILGPCPIYRGKRWKAHSPRFPGKPRPEPTTKWQVPGPLIQAPITTIKSEEPQVIPTIKKHKVSLLSILEPASHLFLSLPDPGPPRKVLFGIYWTSPQRVISLSLYPAPGEISISVTPF
jgi:hypothetical protein